MCVSEIRVNQIRVNQGLGVLAQQHSTYFFCTLVLPSIVTQSLKHVKNFQLRFAHTYCLTFLAIFDDLVTSK